MGNITITNVDLGPIQLGNNDVLDKTITGTTTQAFLAGTILARQTVSTTMTATITGTGTHVLTVASMSGRTPQVGSYTLLAGTLSSGVGAWTLTAPDGQTETLTTSSKTAAMNFPRLGISATPAAAGTDFVTADSVAIVIAASTTLPFVAFSPTGSNGAQKPCAVLVKALTLAAGTGSGPVAISGKVNRTRLIIAADGTGANVTDAVCDQLRDSSIIPLAVQQTAVLDNQ